MKACSRYGRYRTPASLWGRRGTLPAEIAHSPSWAGDSEHILYQSMDKLKTIDVESGETREIPLDLKYTPVGSEGPDRGARRSAG